MKRLNFSLVLLFVISFTGFSQSDEIKNLFQQSTEICFNFVIDQQTDLNKISSIVSIDKVNGNTVLAYANKQEFEAFLELGLDYYYQPSPAQLATGIVMRDNVDFTTLDDWDFYPTYDEYVSLMNDFAAAYPNLCEIIDFGTTVDGRALLMAHINNDLNDTSDPGFMYTSTMHGDETTGYVMMLSLIDYLLTNYGADDQVNDLINGLDIYINPNANPDGTYSGGNQTVNGATRYNGNSVDLNRNYPDPEDGPHPDGNAWQPETEAFMAFAESHNLIMSANFHGGAEVVNYPFDTWSDLHADDAWWQYVCHEYADTAQLYSPNGYLSGFNDGITNGYDWYTTSGCRQDYMTYFQHCREVTIELSNTKLIPATQLVDYWNYNYRSLLNFMTQSLYGIKGTVTDLNTGNPVEATVFIDDHDLLESQVYSSPETGKYNRVIKGGTYDLTFIADGYMPLHIENVEVQDYETIFLDAQMDVGELSADFSANKTNIPAGEEVSFTDMSYGGPISWEWSFEGGTPAISTEQYPVVSWNEEGSFDVSLTVYDGDGNSNIITKENYITVSLEYIMTNNTITTSGGIFYDSGNVDGNYSDLEDYSMTFYPGEENTVIKCVFNAFNVEDDANCAYDYLKIYNGPSASSPLLGTYCGTNSPGAVIADNEDGALTFVFHSDQSVNKSGWEATISCKDGVGIYSPEISSIKVYPNPLSTDILNITADSPIKSVVICDVSGKMLVAKNNSMQSSALAVDVSEIIKGIYFARITLSNDRVVIRKIVVE